MGMFYFLFDLVMTQFRGTLCSCLFSMQLKLESSFDFISLRCRGLQLEYRVFITERSTTKWTRKYA